MTEGNETGRVIQFSQRVGRRGADLQRVFQVMLVSLCLILNNAGEGKVWVWFNKFINFIYLVLAGLGPRGCVRAFSSCSERGLLFTAVCGLLIVVASLVAEHGL